ncbi:NarK/NasA family nitrate transporter [Lysobacter pythonis]|uniref:NarK/NasA family nitrate transporter n=1 Tax=Solilutibacter pythonis TaxID=2483112 RepID=A0A3M2I5P3_9GAMM|nr:MFS transporter [Lysobacter pythonis]RMH93777.1 NarK/NasA family nitrate transporter [Lysobacter pythonis]
MTINRDSAAHPSGTWLARWQPEDSTFWNEGGSTIAWRTLILTTVNLTLAFVAWFLVSALVVRLPQVGFQFTPSQLFWLTAMPGLAGGTLRLIHMFLTPMYGTRHVVSLSTLSLLFPLVGWFFAVQNPATPYWMLMLLAFLAGLGGGNFSSFMPSTSLFFPKRLLGTALAIQAGIGNLGVSVVQFVTPWVIGFAMLGGAAFMGDSQTLVKNGVESQVYMQNAAAVFIPFVLVFGVTAFLMLKSVPVKANFAEQFDIFKSRHTWSMTSLYIMTFGGFSGLAATFPLLIKQGFGGFENAPDPLKWAFWGPLVGSLARVLAGPLSDKLGGARVTHWAGIGMVVCTGLVALFASPASLADFPKFVAAMLALFFFAGVGNASTFKQMPMLFAPRQAAGVIGFTAAIAAYGPFLFGMLFAWAFGASRGAAPVFHGLTVFFAFNVALNWWMYARRGAANPC